MRAFLRFLFSPFTFAVDMLKMTWTVGVGMFFFLSILALICVVVGVVSTPH